jgi:serine/threonine protein kinase
LTEDFPVYLTRFRPGTQLAGYRLEARVGTGGMAVVFRARDQRLDRPVALKILAPWLTEDEVVRRRFIAESRAAAAVDHPHIIPVYEAGEADGVLFIAMRFVQGGDLGGLLRREGALPPGRAAAFISPVAAALDAAHRAGLVHRDVKPGNILVDARPDQPDHVYLSDFGISKAAMSSTGLTGAGRWLGTAEYAPPEQIQGHAVDGRADQYALACVAFQLLAASMPFERDQEIALLYAHMTDPPPSLVSRRPGLPGAADAVIAKAMAKVPEKRYGSCREFADALREALGVPPYHSTAISATDTGPTEPAPAPQTADSGPLKLNGHQATDEASGPPVTPPDEDVVPDPAEAQTSDQPGLRADERDTAAGDLHPDPPNLRTADPPRPPDGDSSRDRVRPVRPRRLRVAALVGLAVVILAGAGIAAAVLTSPPGPAATFVATQSGDTYGLAFSPDGTLLATGASPGSTDLWDPATGYQAATLTDPDTQGVESVAFSPDGSMLAAGDADGSTYLWNVLGEKLIATLTDPQGTGDVDSVAFSPNGTMLAAGSEDGSTYLWNLSSRTRIATLTDAPGSDSAVNSVAFSPDSSMLATGDGDGSTYLWNVSSRRQIATLTNPGASPNVSRVAFSPNGATLAVGDYDEGDTFLWNVAARSVIATLSQPGGTAAVAFSPNGARLATGGWKSGDTYVWNVSTHERTTTVTDPGGKGVASVAFSPDGKTLATGDANGHAYLWDIG